MIYECFYDQSVTGRNYTSILEDQMEGDGNTNFGLGSATNMMTPIAIPTVFSEDEVTSTLVLNIADQTTGFEVASLFDGYGVYKSTTGPIVVGNPGVYLGDATFAGGVWTYTDVAYNEDAWYAVKVKWDGGTAAFFAPLYSYGTSGYVYQDHVSGTPNEIPVSANVLTAPDPHDGNIVSEQVTITADVTDLDAGDTLSADYRVDGGAWTPFAQTGVSPLAVSAVYSFPNGFTEGAHTVEVRGYDGQDYSPIANGAINIVDTTDPVLTTNIVPGATIYATQPATFQVGYGDFCDFDTAVGVSYFRYRIDGGAWTDVPWTPSDFAWGSYLWNLNYQFPGGTFAVGNVVDYQGVATDTAATPNTAAWAGGSFTVLAAPPGVQDPFVVYGRLWLYDGDGPTQTYTPVLSTSGLQIVTATWISSFDGSTLTRTDTTNNLGQYSIDLLNYTDGADVMLTATFETGAQGANYTTIVAAAGSVYQNVVCGVPYEVIITAPLPASNQQSGVAFGATYVIQDYFGALATGYFTHADGPMVWTSSDVAFVPPAPYVFDGVADGGTHNDLLTLFSGGPQWINISETTCDFFPTPWGAIQMPTGFVGGVLQFADGWYDDYDNITVNVLAGGFDWNVVVGWNIVSVPQNPVEQGTSGTFDAYDALEFYASWQLAGFTQLSLADRTGPSAYNMFDYGQPEAAAFAMDGVHGYWIYCDVAGIVHFNSTNYSAGANVVNAAAGWNLLGFTHNYVVWATVPTASMFTDGTVDAALDIAGALTNIIATEWLEAPADQWYHSYVVTDTFPGMLTHNWAWDFGYSSQPGNGFFLWVDAAAVVTFDVAF
jgi:hypothetical protein